MSSPSSIATRRHSLSASCRSGRHLLASGGDFVLEIGAGADAFRGSGSGNGFRAAFQWSIAARLTAVAPSTAFPSASAESYSAEEVFGLLPPQSSCARELRLPTCTFHSQPTRYRSSGRRHTTAFSTSCEMNENFQFQTTKLMGIIPVLLHIEQCFNNNH